MRRASLLSVLVAGSLALPVAPAHAAFDDVAKGYWARPEIKFVAQDRSWMRDFGTQTFRPDEPLQRRHLARAMVRAFAPKATASRTFTDLPKSDPFHRFASVAVERKWLPAAGGAFSPLAGVTKIVLDRALIRALGLTAEVKGLNQIRTADGWRLPRPKGFPFLVLAHQLRLHHNHPTTSEQRELWPQQQVLRADAAYALQRAKTTPSWRLSSLSRYRSIVLPAMTSKQKKAVTFALASVGAPYVYAGEWHERTPSGYCCGPQVVGGFDCSGYVWWVLRAPGGGWDNTAHRPYSGWALPERSSAQMAKAAPTRIKYGKTRPMDVMLFDTNQSKTGWSGVNHTGLSLGKGWMIHSASGVAGVTIDWVGDGWYRDRFKWSRRLIA